jgi:hypothetical protein
VLHELTPYWRLLGARTWILSRSGPEPHVAVLGVNRGLPIAHPCPCRQARSFRIPGRVGAQRGNCMSSIQTPVTAIYEVALVESLEKIIVPNVARVPWIASYSRDDLRCQPAAVTLGVEMSHPAENAACIVQASGNPVAPVTVAQLDGFL